MFWFSIYICMYDCVNIAPKQWFPVFVASGWLARHIILLVANLGGPGYPGIGKWAIWFGGLRLFLSIYVEMCIYIYIYTMYVSTYTCMYDYVNIAPDSDSLYLWHACQLVILYCSWLISGVQATRPLANAMWLGGLRMLLCIYVRMCIHTYIMYALGFLTHL